MTVVPYELAPPAYESSDGGSSPSGPPPSLTAVSGSSWPQDVQDYFLNGRVDDAAEEDKLQQSAACSTRRRDGYTAVSIDPSQMNSTRRRYDGEVREDFPILERSGSSVIVQADEPWVKDVELLYQFVLSKRPVLPPPISLRFTFYGKASNISERANEPSMTAFKPKDQHLFSFTTPIYVPRPSKTPLVPAGSAGGSTPHALYEGDNLGGGQLRAVQDDVPCYRGNPYLPNGLAYLTGRVNSRLLGPNSTARVKAPVVSAVQMRSGQLIDERSGLPISRRMGSVAADGRLQELWNLTRRRGMREPWRAPITRPEYDDDDIPQTLNCPSALRVDIMTALKEFIDQPSRPAKMLVFDLVPYGWDLNALQEATMKLVNEQVGQPGWFSSTDPIGSVRVTYERVGPWLDLSVRKTRLHSLPIDAGVERIPVPRDLFAVGTLSVIGIILSFLLTDIGSDDFSIWCVRLLTLGSIAGVLYTGWRVTLLERIPVLMNFFAIGGLSVFGLFSSIMLTYTVSDVFATWCVHLLTLTSIAGAFYTGCQVMLLSRVLCTDTILMAHPLKRWCPTGLPTSYSREEVLTSLTKRRLVSSGGEDRETIHLSRRATGWYVLQGMREGDWLRDHQAVLVAAIRERKSRDLTGDVLTDTPVVQRQKRRDAREEDDSVGL